MSRSKRRALARTNAQITSTSNQAHQPRVSQQETDHANFASSAEFVINKGLLGPASLFPHAAYISQVLMQGEKEDQFQQLRADFIAEYQPVGLTEQILTDELAQHFWRLKRYRGLELQMFKAQTSPTADRNTMPLDVANLVKCIELKLFNSLLRIQQAAERSFYKALKTLHALQKARGFVFSKASKPVKQQQELEKDMPAVTEAEVTEFLKRSAA